MHRALISIVFLAACSGQADDQEVPTSGLPLLGDGTHTLADGAMRTIATSAEALATPRDLAFHPEVEGQLWVVNNGDHSMTLLSDAGTDAQSSRHWRDSFSGAHFLAKPAALAFGASGSLATIHDEDEKTQSMTPTDFMGPTLWTSDPEEFDGGHEGHLDMLHNSPNGTGIAWETDNVYWVFDGYHSSITRYDFQSDHGLGGTDHSDGIVHRFVEGEVAYADGVSSHLVFDAETALLYVADTGNGRIAVLDTTTGEEGSRITPDYDGGRQRSWDGAEIWTLTDEELVAPSGLEIHDDLLWVTDNATSRILAYDLDGTLIDWVDTGLPEGALMGIAFGPEGDLFLVDAAGDQVLAISAP